MVKSLTNQDLAGPLLANILNKLVDFFITTLILANFSITRIKDLQQDSVNLLYK